MHAFSLNPTLTCQHCGLSDQFTSHGFVYQKKSLEAPQRVGKRLLCSNRFGRSGCGRTVQLYLTETIPRLHYSASTMFVFLLALLNTSSVVAAYQHVTRYGDTRHAWRWLLRLYRQLPRWRSRYVTQPSSLSFARFTARSARLQVLLMTLSDLFAPGALTSCGNLQMLWQEPFC